MPNKSSLTFEMVGKNEKLLSALNESNRKLSSFSKQQAQRNKQISSSFKAIGGALAGAFAVGKLISFGKEAKNLAGEFQGVSAAFNQFTRSEKVLEDLRKATRGTVSDLQLMQNAIKAKNFKIPMDVLAKGLEFATKRAAQTGESVDYLVESFTTGLGRQSVMILDNLGISATELNAEVKKTGDFMTAVGNITDRELTKMGDVILTDSQRMEQFRANIDNAKVSFGALILKGFTPFINLGNRLFEIANKQSKALMKERTELNVLIGVATSATISEEARLTVIRDIQKEYPDFLKNIKAETISNDDLIIALQGVNESYKERIKLAILTEILAAEENKYTKQIADEIRLTSELQSAEATLAKRKEEYAEATKNGIDVNNQASDALRIAQDRVDNLQKRLGRNTDQINKWEYSLTKAKNAVVAQTKALDELGKVPPPPRITTEDDIILAELLAESYKNLNDELKTIGKEGYKEATKYFSDMSKKSERIRVNVESYLFTDDEEFIDEPAVDAAIEAYRLNLERIKEQTQQFKDELNNTFNSLIEGGITDLASALGEAFATQDFSGVFSSIINSVASFAQQFGGLLIAQGLAIEAFKKSLESLNGVVAIVAGIALVAAAGALRVLASKGAKGFAMGGIVPGTSFTGDRVPALVNSGEMILNKGQQSNLFGLISGNTGGIGGGQVVFKIGNDELVGTLENYSRKRQIMR